MVTDRDIIVSATRHILKMARVVLDLSAERFCDHTEEIDPGGGWSFATYRKWENGERLMSLSALRQFAEYVGADRMELKLYMSDDEVITAPIFDSLGNEQLEHKSPKISPPGKAYPVAEEEAS